MPHKNKRVYVCRGINKGAWGTVIHEDQDSFHLITDDGIDVYDRKVNVIFSQQPDSQRRYP